MEESAKNPDEKDNGAQNFNSKDLGGAEKAVQIERLSGLSGVGLGGIYS